MGMIGRIAALWLKFGENTKTDRRIPWVEDGDDNLGKYCHMEVFFNIGKYLFYYNDVLW